MVDSLRYEGNEDDVQFAIFASEALKYDPVWQGILIDAGTAIIRMFRYLDAAGLQDVHAMEFKSDPESPPTFIAIRNYQTARDQPEREKLNE